MVAASRLFFLFFFCPPVALISRLPLSKTHLQIHTHIHSQLCRFCGSLSRGFLELVENLELNSRSPVSQHRKIFCCVPGFWVLDFNFDFDV